MKQYFRIFGEKGEDFTRYWASISNKSPTEKEGETAYVSAAIGVRLSKDAEKVFKENSEKTKTKGIKQCLIKSNDFWLKAVLLKPKEDDDTPRSMVILFINSAEAADPEEDD